MEIAGLLNNSATGSGQICESAESFLVNTLAICLGMQDNYGGD